MALLKGVKNIIGTALVPLDISVASAASIGTYGGQIQGTAQIAFQFIVDSADGAPIAEIYGSNDNENWDIYEISTGVTTIALPLSDSISVVRDTFPHEFICVVVDAGGATVGTISATINVKEQTTV